MSFAHRLALIPFLSILAFAADPREFGRAELRQAWAEKKLPGSSQLAESIAPGPPESWTLSPGKVSGADARGVLYGLLEAAEQVRKTGRITSAKGAPKTAIR